MLSTPLPTSWDLAESLPSHVKPQAIDTAIGEHRQALTPATPQEFAAVVGKAMEWASAFGITVVNPQQVTAQYRDALADLPIDLLHAGFQRIKHDWQWRNMPLPGQIREQIEEAHALRQRELSRLEFARRKAFGPRPASHDHIPADDEWKAKLRQANERWLFHNHTDEDVALLNRQRAKHGFGPLPSEAERGLGIQAMPGTKPRRLA